MVILDGWSNAGTYYVGIFATFVPVSQIGYDPLCLSFSPTEDEATHSAQENLELIEFVLENNCTNTSNLVAIIVDNCVTNRALIIIMGDFLVGCAIHRKNLALKEVITSHIPRIDRVKSILNK